MITILLCGKKEDSSIKNALLNSLQNYGCVQYYDGECLINTNQKTEPCFVIYDCEKIPQCSHSEGILLFKNSFIPTKDIVIPSKFVPVFESRNYHAAEALNGTGSVALTCGTSAKDTLSIASLDYKFATVSLQRNVKTIYGKIIEPHDFTIDLKEILSPYQLLSVCSILILSGIECNSQYLF